MLRKQELGGDICGAGTQISEKGALPSEHLSWHRRLVLEVWKEAGSKTAAWRWVMLGGAGRSSKQKGTCPLLLQLSTLPLLPPLGRT